MRYGLILVSTLAVVVAGCAGPFGGARRSAGLRYYPSVGGPGPGVISSASMPGTNNSQNAAFLAAQQSKSAQLAFQGVDGMKIYWDVAAPGLFDSEPLICPNKYNFEQGKVYRLKLTNIPTRPGLVLYPTLTVNSASPRTKSYLDHNAIPIKFTDNDFDQVESGNFVTKVVFLPSPEFQNLAVAGGVDTIVNTQLPAGADPIATAQNRGAILAVIKIGNKNLALENPMNLEGVLGEGYGSEAVPQIPISGVNVPEFGTPNTVTPYGVPGPAKLPAAQPQQSRNRLLNPINPVPATDVPEVQGEWSGNKF